MAFVIEPTLGRTFLERVRQTPELEAFRFKKSGHWRSVTFEEFRKHCEKVSLGLASLGVKPGDRVALLSETRYEWPLCDLAILGAGAITVPIYGTSTPRDIAYVLKNSGSNVVIVENYAHLKKVFESEAPLEKIIVIEASAMTLARDRKDVVALQALSELATREKKHGSSFVKHLEEAKPSDLLTICYTSGTTGVPKGVMLTHANLRSTLEDSVQLLRDVIQPEEDTLLSFLPYSHILGKLESVSLYAFGWTVAFAESREKLMDNFREVQPTILFTVPRAFEKTYDRIRERVESLPGWQKKVFEETLSAGERLRFIRPGGPEGRKAGRINHLVDSVRYGAGQKVAFRKVREIFGGKLRFAICGGAPLPAEIGEFFDLAGVRILEGYGLTETCAPITFNPPDAPRFGTVGKPLKDVALRLAPDGEILVKSGKLFQGYYNDPKSTQEAFTEEGWFKTGDVGQIDDEGYLHITDRKKDLIITSGGKNIAPQKIEALAEAQPLIHQFVVHGDRRKFLTALVTLKREVVEKFANQHQVLYSDFAELVKNPHVLAWVQKEIDEVNEQLAPFEAIKRFRILPQEFTVEAGEITPSQKIRRRFIEKRYQEELNSMYAPLDSRPQIR